MTSISTVIVWNSIQLYEGSNTTQEEIRHYLQKLNHDIFIKLLPSVIVFIALITIGVCGNLLVFLVYLKQYKSSAMRVFVLEMAACDFLTNILVIPWLIQDARYSYTSNSHFCRFQCFVGTFPVIMSYLILACVACDRRRRVCQVHKRQLSARQAMFLLILPLVLSSSSMAPFAYLYDTMPLETDRPGITGTSCGFSEIPLTIKAKQLYGGVLMIHFLVGLVVLTVCYVHIAFRIFQQKKRLFVRQINFSVTSSVTKTNLDEDIVSSQKEQHTKTFQKKFISVAESEEGTEKASNQKEHERDKKMEASLDACIPDTPSISYQTEVFECLSDSIVTQTAHSPIQFPEKSFDKPYSHGSANLSEPIVKASTANTTHDSTCPKKSSVWSWGTKDREIKVRRKTVSSEGSQRKRTHLSRTTLMMLVLTIATVICCSPYIALA